MKRKVKTAFLILPNSIFPELKLSNYDKVFVVEEPMFFAPRDYQISKIKVAYLRASMRYFYDHVAHGDKEYIAFSEVRNYEFLRDFQTTYYDSVDRDLEEKLGNLVPDLHRLETLLFLLPQSECISYFQKSKKRFVQQHFFEHMKGRLGVLRNVGSQDHENRKPLPKNHQYKFGLPDFDKKEDSHYYEEAKSYVENHPVFKTHLGSCKHAHRYPIQPEAAKEHFLDFLKHRAKDFGPFEDAVSKKESILYHSFISAPLNVGILSPKWVLDTIMDYPGIPMNSLEGFVRQLIGWREYQRGIYVSFPQLAQANHFEHQRKLKWEFWNGSKSIGIPLLDNEIRKALELGYCHHIPRLCIFLNMFNLLGVELEEIVKWFSQIVCMDAYPWVMYSNIASMGYFDTRFMQKPYVTASAYLLKMSDYEKGPWCDIWNALFYHFLHTNKSKLTGGAAVYLRNLVYFEKKSAEEQSKILSIARDFINKVTD
jgi:deoxyribodipyrimidine photolyase-related protein